MVKFDIKPDVPDTFYCNGCKVKKFLDNLIICITNCKPFDHVHFIQTFLMNAWNRAIQEMADEKNDDDESPLPFEKPY